MVTHTDVAYPLPSNPDLEVWLSRKSFGMFDKTNTGSFLLSENTFSTPDFTDFNLMNGRRK